jgi:hypothetical protein
MESILPTFVEQFHSSYNGSIDTLSQFFKTLKSPEQPYSTIKIDIPSKTGSGVFITEAINYFKDNWNGRFRPYTRFSGKYPSMLIIKMFVLSIPKTARDAIRSKYPMAVFHDFKTIPEFFQLKVAGIPDSFLDSNEKLKALGSLFHEKDFKEAKVCDYNGAYLNQALFAFKKVPLAALFAPKGSFNPFNQFSTPLKILWNRSISCKCCKLVGHTIDFCPLSDLHIDEIKHINEYCCSINNWLNISYVDEYNSTHKIKRRNYRGGNNNNIIDHNGVSDSSNSSSSNINSNDTHSNYNIKNEDTHSTQVEQNLHQLSNIKIEDLQPISLKSKDESNNTSDITNISNQNITNNQPSSPPPRTEKDSSTPRVGNASPPRTSIPSTHTSPKPTTRNLQDNINKTPKILKKKPTNKDDNPSSKRGNKPLVRHR